MNHNLATKVSNFLLGNGFYIALTACVGIIGMSGYYLMNSITPEEPISPVVGSTQIELPTISQPVETPQITTTQPTPVPIPVPSDSKVEESVKPTEVLQESDEDLKSIVDDDLENLVEETIIQFCLPANGTLLQGHSLEVLAYHATFGDWRTHSGIDIETEIGSEVFAAANGHVAAIFVDDMSGSTIVLSHGQETETTYANLSEEVFVEIGDTVEMGQAIGTVGDTALSEKGSPPHLDFFMTVSGEEVDPMQYLPSF